MLLLGGSDVPDAQFLRSLHIAIRGPAPMQSAKAKRDWNAPPVSVHSDVTGTLSCVCVCFRASTDGAAVVHQWLTSRSNIVEFYADGFALIGNAFVNWHKLQKLSTAHRTPHSVRYPSHSSESRDPTLKPVSLDSRHLAVFAYVGASGHRSSSVLNVTTGVTQPLEPDLRAFR